MTELPDADADYDHVNKQIGIRIAELDLTADPVDVGAAVKAIVAEWTEHATGYEYPECTHDCSCSEQ